MPYHISTPAVIAHKAREIILECFHEIDDFERAKIAIDKINDLLTSELIGSYPNDTIITKESAYTEYSSGSMWLCKPLSCETFYDSGISISTFSLGLIIDGKPIFGIVDNPFARQYRAESGRYAMDTSAKNCEVSKVNISNGLIVVTNDIKEIVKNTYISKIPNPIAMCDPIYDSILVATGKYAGFINEKATNIDVAVAQIIVEEAGGKVTDLIGNELDYSKSFRGVVMSNDLIHNDLLNIVNG